MRGGLRLPHEAHRGGFVTLIWKAGEPSTVCTAVQLLLYSWALCCSRFFPLYKRHRQETSHLRTVETSGQGFSGAGPQTQHLRASGCLTGAQLPRVPELGGRAEWQSSWGKKPCRVDPEDSGSAHPGLSGPRSAAAALPSPRPQGRALSRRPQLQAFDLNPPWTQPPLATASCRCRVPRRPALRPAHPPGAGGP